MSGKSIKKKHRQAWILILIALPLLLGPLVMRWLLGNKPEIDSKTLCLMAGAPSRSVILLDKSDAWDQEDVGRVKNLLTRIYKEVPAGERLSIYGIVGEEGTSTNIRQFFDMCNPGTVQECNAIYEDCRAIKRTYDSAFDGPLASLASHLQEPGHSSYSPLLESVSEIWSDTHAPVLHLHVVSDLMENGVRFRFYDVVPLDEDMIGEYPLQRTRDASVVAHVIQRRRHSRDLQRAVESAWAGYFRKQDVSVVFEPLLITE